jgi:ABC-2 type transport system ATP-binding protein
MNSGYAVTASGLAKSYGTVEALRGLDLRIPQGSLCGLAGMNGAGKTTTLRVLLGMARPSAGSATVCGVEIGDERRSVAIRRRAALVPEQKDLFPYMSVGQVLTFTRGFYPGWDESLASWFLREFALPLDRCVTKLSRGMLAQLHLLLSFSRGASIVFLDEPTDGLDPVASEIALQAMVSAVARSGVTVVFCTHRLNEIEQVCDHLCLIDAGRTLVDEPLEELQLRTRRLSVVFDGPADPFLERFRDAWPGLRATGRTLSGMVRGDWRGAAELARGLGAASVQTETVTLRELFLELTGRASGVLA